MRSYEFHSSNGVFVSKLTTWLPDDDRLDIGQKITLEGDNTIWTVAAMAVTLQELGAYYRLWSKHDQ